MKSNIFTITPNPVFKVEIMSRYFFDDYKTEKELERCIDYLFLRLKNNRYIKPDVFDEFEFKIKGKDNKIYAFLKTIL